MIEFKIGNYVYIKRVNENSRNENETIHFRKVKCFLTYAESKQRQL